MVILCVCGGVCAHVHRVRWGSAVVMKVGEAVICIVPSVHLDDLGCCDCVWPSLLGRVTATVVLWLPRGDTGLPVEGVNRDGAQLPSETSPS